MHNTFNEHVCEQVIARIPKLIPRGVFQGPILWEPCFVGDISLGSSVGRAWDS